MRPQLIQALHAGPATSAQLAAALDISQPTVSRLLAANAGRIVPIGAGRTARYALRREIHDLAPELPVYRIGQEGTTREIGTLAPVHGGFAYQDHEAGRREFFPGLPWFLSDMRPQGFLGRSFPKAHPELGLPARRADWSEDHYLVALARRSEDMVGNLLVGEESFHRWQQIPLPLTISARARTRRYPALVAQTLSGDPPGSSAGGEQPKFLVSVEQAPGLRHALVKFSEPQTSPAGRRSADLLICEHLALECLREAGVEAARSQLLEAGNRWLLEVQRFDRVGKRGRLGLISLGALDDEFVGERRNWLATALELERLGWLTRADVSRIGWLQAYGGFIANTDMHFGNLSLLYEGGRKLGLAPAYDMLPMLYAPQRGEVVARRFNPPPPPARAIAEARAAREAALMFWQRAAADRRISAAFRAIAGENLRSLEQLHW